MKFEGCYHGHGDSLLVKAGSGALTFGQPSSAGVPASIGGRRVHWVEPEVVVEIEFAAWTGDRRLRHPVFRRVRDDKDVSEAIGDA